MPATPHRVDRTHCVAMVHALAYQNTTVIHITDVVQSVFRTQTVL